MIQKEEVSKKELKHHSRRLSIKEGIYNSIKISLGEHYIRPFAIAINSSNSLVALITSITGIFGPISQIFGSKTIGKRSRKKVISRSVLIESFSWLLISLIGALYILDIKREILPLALIIIFSISTFFTNYGYPAWFSLMGETVDKNNRGRWFSKRTTISSFILVLFSVGAAFGLEYLKGKGYPHLGFIILFFIAFISRLGCSALLMKQYEKELKKKEEKENLISFLKKLNNTDFGKFVLFRGILAASMSLTSSLIAIYLLRYLGLDYISYILISLAGTIFSVFLLNFWGKIADKYGNYKVLSITSLFIPLTPILWILSPSKIYLFFIPALIGGVSWAGFLMASSNYIYLNTSKKNQGTYISYLNLVIGMGIFLGAIISAFLLENLKTDWIEPLILIFIIGFLLRAITISYWMPKLKDDQMEKKLKGMKELRKIIFKEIKPTINESFHQLMQIKSYLKEK